MKDKCAYRKLKYVLPAFLVLAVSILIYCTTFRVKASSEYPYLIKVNRQMCTVTVYKKDSAGKYTKPVKAMLCSPGYDTPIGTFHTKVKYRWKILSGNVWGQYSTRIVNGILFHSVWYYQKDPSTLSNKQFNNLGTICSHGCVRLAVADVKWIYDNCPVGTTVVIYDSSNPGPLGKPSGIKVSESKKTGYDPTDIWSSGNPYIRRKVSITGASNKTYTYGEAVSSLTSGVKAVSSTGADISSSIKVTITYNGKKVSKINTKNPGIYKVTYSVTDSSGKKASKTVIVTVKQCTASPVIKGVIKSRIVKNGTKVTRTYVLKGVTAFWNGSALSQSKIQTDITKNDTVYTIKYSVTAPNGKMVTKTAKVIVDNQEPVISGVKDYEIAWDDEVTEELVMKNIKVKDNYTELNKSDIKVTIKKSSSRKYTVTYKVSDEYGNTAVKTAVYTITNFLRFEIPEKLEINSDVILDEDYVMASGIKAYNNKTDITKEMEIAYEENSDGNYDVILTIRDDNGHVRTEKVIFYVVDNLQ